MSSWNSRAYLLLGIATVISALSFLILGLGDDDVLGASIIFVVPALVTAIVAAYAVSYGLDGTSLIALVLALLGYVVLWLLYNGHADDSYWWIFIPHTFFTIAVAFSSVAIVMDHREYLANNPPAAPGSFVLSVDDEDLEIPDPGYNLSDLDLLFCEWGLRPASREYVYCKLPSERKAKSRKWDVFRACYNDVNEIRKVERAGGELKHICVCFEEATTKTVTDYNSRIGTVEVRDEDTGAYHYMDVRGDVKRNEIVPKHRTDIFHSVDAAIPFAMAASMTSYDGKAFICIVISGNRHILFAEYHNGVIQAR